MFVSVMIVAICVCNKFGGINYVGCSGEVTVG